MEKQPGIAVDTMGPMIVLSVSPLEEDQGSLQAIIRHSTWNLLHARDLRSGLDLLQQHQISVVLSELVLLPGTWIDLLDGMNSLPHPPALIVTSKLADDHLWSVALNLGAWDVLAKPFDREEVIRSLKSGWQHWHNQIQMSGTAGKVMTAGS
jgi:DNA-binding response OmpR family regulator